MPRPTLTQGLLTVIAALLVANLGLQILDKDSGNDAPGDTVAGPAAAPQPTPSSGVPEVLRARLIELVDANGEARAQLYVGEDGGGNLRLRDANGEVRVKLGATDDGSGLLLLDGDVQPAIWLAIDREGTRLTLAQQGTESTVIRP